MIEAPLWGWRPDLTILTTIDRVSPAVQSQRSRRRKPNTRSIHPQGREPQAEAPAFLPGGGRIRASTGRRAQGSVELPLQSAIRKPPGASLRMSGTTRSLEEERQFRSPNAHPGLGKRQVSIMTPRCPGLAEGDRAVGPVESRVACSGVKETPGLRPQEWCTGGPAELP